jgi:cytochrome c2
MKPLTWLTIILTVMTPLLTGVTQPVEVSLQIKDQNQLIRTFSLSQLQTLIPSSVVKVLDPYKQNIQQYKGFAINVLLESLYGNNWQQQEEVLLTSPDGYQVAIPMKRFLQYQGFLAYENVNSPQFEITNNLVEQTIMELTPFYLIWDNINQPHSSQLSQWPYQIMSIELVKFAEKFPQMMPPAESSDEVKRGLLTFRNFCQNCHSINGDGGKKALDLNYPISVMEYMDEAKLKIWISSPTDILPDTTMPALPYQLKNREQKISDIIAYLKVMAQYQREPAPEVLTSP